MSSRPEAALLHVVQRGAGGPLRFSRRTQWDSYGSRSKATTYCLAFVVNAMSIKLFNALLQRPEGEALDFKQASYNLATDRNALIKDILAMSNTPRDGDAHIVLGVRWTPEEGARVIGLSSQLDDEQLQSAMGEDRVQPRPLFVYLPLEVDGLHVGIITIRQGSDGPYTALKDYGELHAGVIYYRRGSKNDRAIGGELRRIVEWFSSGASTPFESFSRGTWSQFIDAVSAFGPGRAYILCADHIPATSAAPIHALAMVPWRCVLDFDPNSESNGLLSVVAGPLQSHRFIHRAVKGEHRIQPDPGTHWFFARGLSGRQETVADKDHRSWLKSYKREVARQLECMATAISPSPITVVVLWNDVNLRSHLRTLLEELHGAFDELAEIIVVHEESGTFDGLCEDAGVPHVQMSLRSLCAGLMDHFAHEQHHDSERIWLPTASGSFIEIEPQDLLWLSEDLELVYRGIGANGTDPLESYRKGATISWRNLHLGHDCARDTTPSLRASVESELQRRQTVRINLYHAPGAGGTTVGRRVLWDLHTIYPTMVLTRCDPRETAVRLSKVASITESPVLVLIDGGDHSERDIDDLYDYLRAGQTPALLLQVLRRFRRQRTGKRQFWLDASLSNAEADRFREALSRATPSQAQNLAGLARQQNDPQRNAFFFGLIAYGKDFRGLEPYVERYVQNLTDEQRRIIAYIAIAHYYGQRSIPGQAFAPLLGIPRSRTVQLGNAFSDEASAALSLLAESPSGDWRTSHHLVALEILHQVLAPKLTRERDLVWRQSLSSWAKDFTGFCCGPDHTPSEKLLELVRRVFIYRDNADLLGTERSNGQQFAHLIEDIPSTHGRIDVLRNLTDTFPLEAHFHAHLGRFLGLNGQFEAARESVEHGISLQPDDHVLHHMRGMVIRRAIQEKGRTGAPLEDIIMLAKAAAESFEATRQISPDLEHGYISEVQLLVNVIDLAGQRRPKASGLLASNETDPFLRNALGRAEELLDRVQTLYSGEEPNRYVLDCRARLQSLYGNFTDALQAWQNLLTRPDVAKPPVRRQIVWTMLRRRDGDWAQFTQKDVDRAAQLLAENLEEESNDSTSLRLWLRAIRHVKSPPSIDAVIERVGYWKANTHSLDAAYYLYVLHALRALEGSGQALGDMERALEECRTITRYRRDRTRSFEWVGAQEGVQRLVHQSRLGDWRGDFWGSTSALALVAGRIASIEGPQKGVVELSQGLMAFFVPGKGGFHSGRDENSAVECYLGFSYDGIRAWNVRRR